MADSELPPTEPTVEALESTDEATETVPAETAIEATRPGVPALMPPTSAVLRKRPRRVAFGSLGGLLALLFILSGSVFVAHGLATNASVAPDTQVRTLPIIAHVVQQNPSSAQSTPAPCASCSSSHNAYAKGPTAADELVVVSIAKQQLWAYQDGKLVLTSLVTTGMPQLPTPTGTFHVFLKETDVMFYSPWPPGSEFYYTPEHINYAMEFLDGGYYIHDAPWRHEFGPGTNVPHTDPDGTQETGSHGCVNMPTSAAAQLYRWLIPGATVTIEN